VRAADGGRQDIRATERGVTQRGQRSGDLGLSACGAKRCQAGELVVLGFFVYLEDGR